jgi:hypothetical protein
MVVWLELAVPFHSAPGEEEFHTTPEFHVNGSGMGPDFAGTGTILARVFFRGKMAYEGKNCDSGGDVLQDVSSH